MIYTLRCAICMKEANVTAPEIGYPVLHVCPKCKMPYAIIQMPDEEMPKVYKLTQTKAVLLKGTEKK